MERKSHARLVKICVCAVAIALEIVLNRFVSINTAGWKIGFAFLPPTLVAILYGPGWSALVYALSDFIGAVLFPIGPYHPGFSICAALMGIVAGLLLCSDPLHLGYEGERFDMKLQLHYNKIGFFTNILPCVLINCILIGLFINTAWVAMLYGSKTYWGWFVYRLPEYAIMVPVQLLLIPVLLTVKKALVKANLVK